MNVTKRPYVYHQTEKNGSAIVKYHIHVAVKIPDGTLATLSRGPLVNYKNICGDEKKRRVYMIDVIDYSGTTYSEPVRFYIPVPVSQVSADEMGFIIKVNDQTNMRNSGGSTQSNNDYDDGDEFPMLRETTK